MFFFKMLSPAYRKRRARVLRFRSIRPSKRRFLRLIQSLSRFDAMGKTTPLPNCPNKTIHFVRYISEQQ